MLNFPGFAVWT